MTNDCQHREIVFMRAPYKSEAIDNVRCIACGHTWWEVVGEVYSDRESFIPSPEVEE